MMKILRHCLIFLVVTASLQPHAAAKPNIVILATGGTIAGSAESADAGGVYLRSGGRRCILINAVPQIKEIANISGEQVANVGSQDMSDAIWLTLAERVNAAAGRNLKWTAS